MNNEARNLTPEEILKRTIAVMQKHIELLRSENQWLRERLTTRLQGEIDNLREEKDRLTNS